MANGEFQSFLLRLREGDQSAAQRLIDDYEAELRIVARARLRDSRVRRTVDASDVCQSVFASFFVRAATGQYDLESPEDLIKLLAKMVRNKAAGKVRKLRADKRDVARQVGDDVNAMPVVGDDHTPSRVFAARELLEKVDHLMPDDIRKISQLRREGQSWQQVAEIVGGTPEAIRKRFSRAMDQIAEEIGIEELGAVT